MYCYRVNLTELYLRTRLLPTSVLLLLVTCPAVRSLKNSQFKWRSRRKHKSKYNINYKRFARFNTIKNIFDYTISTPQHRITIMNFKIYILTELNVCKYSITYDRSSLRSIHQFSLTQIICKGFLKHDELPRGITSLNFGI